MKDSDRNERNGSLLDAVNRGCDLLLSSMPVSVSKHLLDKHFTMI